MTYQTILVPTDGSPASEDSVEHAIDLASRFDATLHALSVVELDVAFSEAVTESMLEDLEARAQTAVDEVATRARDAGLTAVEGEVVRGTPHVAILDYAHDHDVDLIVMGTHGRRGLDRLLLGSVAERVLRTADLPVLTVSGKERDKETDE